MNAGVFGSAESSDFENFAGYFGADGSTGLNYGVLATATGGSGSSYYAGYFGGDVHATGTVTWVSDARFKTNVQNISSGSALAKLGQLQPKTYAFKSADYPYLALPQGNQYGLIAQEVEQVFPELVRDIVHPETKDMLTGKQTSPRLEYKGLNYAGLIPVLVSAVKEQQTEIDSLKEVINTRLTQLEERLNGCCGTGMAGKREETPKSPEGDLTAVRQTVELSNMQAIVLEQNVPNPFAEQTSISYFVPGNYQTAQLVFTDMLGNTIKTTDVKTGYGVMTVFASNLSSGQYSYSLVIDGKVAETKRMVKGR